MPFFECQMLLWIDWQDLATQIFWWDFYRRSCRTNGVKPGTRKFLAPNMAEWLSGSGLTATYHPNNDFHGQFQLQVDRCFETGLYFISFIYIKYIYIYNIYIYNIYIYMCVLYSCKWIVVSRRDCTLQDIMSVSQAFRPDGQFHERDP